MTMKRCTAGLVAAAMLSLAGCAAVSRPRTASGELPPASIRQVGLIDASTGWALTDRGLELTTDGSKFKSISPKGAGADDIVAAFFRDDREGWTLVRGRAGLVTSYRTQDAGRTWTGTGTMQAP